MFMCAHMNAVAQERKERALHLPGLELYLTLSHLGAGN